MRKSTRTRPDNKTGAVNPGSLPFPVVGIGGSAGGLEAFQQLLKALPADLGMSYVFIMHLAPEHKSMLTELLGKQTSMPVSEAVNAMRVEADHVYVIPPNTKLFLSSGKLMLTCLKVTDLKRMPVDYFFQSLAKEQGSRAIGVILSGTASDGTLGAEDIKAEGGIIFAQEGKSAKYDGMPQSAVSAGCADFVLSPEKIAAELGHIAKHPYIALAGAVPQEALNIIEAKGFDSIFELLSRAKGVDFTYYKSATIKRRIARRMVLLKLKKLKDYVNLLRENISELNNLYEDLLINVTRFFREPEVFNALKKQVLPAILKSKTKGETLKIWVPGCSGGEEVYSIAICVLEVLGDKTDTPVQIFGSDVSETNIAKARRGVYSKAVEHDVSPERLKRFFTQDEDSYKISRQLRDMCIYSKQNVFNDPSFSNLDLISCRNLLIYFQPVLQKNVFSKFHYALRPGGYLLLGNSESAGSYANLFKALDRKHRIFTKKYTPISPRLKFGSEYHLPGRQQIKGKAGITQNKVIDIDGLVQETVLGEFGRSGVLIDGDMEVVQFRGRTGRYLESASGKPSNNIFKLVREGLSLPLRAAINKAKETKRKVKREEEFVEPGGRSARVDLTVIPVKSRGVKEDLFLVLFDENGDALSKKNTPAEDRKREKQERSAKNDEYINDLQKELKETKEYLQTIIEDHEKANEEVKTASEELMSSNEELQSTNEELETAKEELQSTNEELLTTNEELQNRNKEASLLSNDLINLLSSINMPVIMMDRGLVIRRVTPQAEKVLNVAPSDIGRPIHKIKLGLDIPDLEKTLTAVIDSLQPETFEARSREGSWYSAYIRPYRTAENVIDGVVAVFVDITGQKKLQRLAEEAREYAENIVEAVREPLMVLDTGLKVISANKSYYKTFKVTRKDTIGRSIYELGGKLWDIAEFRKLLDDISVKNEPFDNFELERDLGSEGKKVMLLSGRQIIKWAGQEQMILLALEDITERRHLENEFIKVHKLDSLGILAGGIAHDFNNLLTGIIGNLSLVRQGIDPASQESEILSDVEKAALRAKNLTLQLLTFAKGGEPVKKPTVLPDLLRESAVFATHGSKTRCDFHIAPDLSVVNVDPGQISQVISNMVINSVQAMPDGGYISITAENVNLKAKPSLPLKTGPYVQIIIKDSGSGIPAGHIGKIFDPYFTTKEAGSGLGLSTSYSIIKNHDGYITVKSEPGKATSFDIYLPAFVEAAAPEIAAPGKELKKGRGRILIMDDEEIIRVLAIRALTKLGYAVESFPDSSQTVERYRQTWGTPQAFDAVILDLTIPGGEGGKEVISELKEINPDVRAVVSSGYSSDPIMALYKEYGFSGVLPKPYSIEEFSEVLYGLLKEDK